MSVEQQRSMLEKICYVMKCFSDSLLFFMTLQGVKRSTLIQSDISIENIYKSDENVSFLRDLALQHNRYIIFHEHYLFLSSERIDFQIGYDHIQMGILLDFPIQYDLDILMCYRLKHRDGVANFCLNIHSIPDHFREFVSCNELTSFMVKKCDIPLVITKTLKWIHKLNKFIQTIYPTISIVLEIDESSDSFDDLTEEDILYYQQFDEEKDSYCLTKNSICSFEC